MKTFLLFIKELLKKVSLRTWIEIIIGLILVISLLVFVKKYNKASDSLAISQNNNTAYQAELEGAKDNIIQFQFSMEQLNYFSDSITNKLRQSIKDNNIKDKKIQELQYLLSHYQRTDTIKIFDTIFKEPDFVMDTTIGDEWMSTNLHLAYPNTICIDSKAKSEKILIFHSEKKTVDPPKKFFLCRWFQKKVTVVEVTVQENNKYIVSDTNRFIHIIN